MVGYEGQTALIKAVFGSSDAPGQAPPGYTGGTPTPAVPKLTPGAFDLMFGPRPEPPPARSKTQRKPRGRN